MRLWLNWLVLLTVVTVFGASFALLGSVIGMSSPWLMLLLMFDFLGIAKVAEPLFRLKIPRALRPVRRCERAGIVYRRLGVLGFGKLLRRSPLRYLNSAVYLARRDGDLSEVRRRAESGEASHFWAAVLFTPYVILAGLNHQWNVAAWFSLTQVLVNVYPILHLRHVRWRLTCTLRKMGRQRATDG
jgi:glycosyl-4,4'-diaponeurosporenoate acyltransferase